MSFSLHSNFFNPTTGDTSSSSSSSSSSADPQKARDVGRNSISSKIDKLSSSGPGLSARSIKIEINEGLSDYVNRNIFEVIETPKYLKSLLEKEGYLELKDGNLSITSNADSAKKSHEQILIHIDGLNKKIDPSIIHQLKERLIDDKIKTYTLSMPTCTITQLIENHKNAHGLASAMKLLDQICDQKIERNQRYASVADWPKERKTPFLHVIPNLGRVSPVPVPITTMKKEGRDQPSCILGMLEPSLESSFVINEEEISNAELLLTPMSSLEKMITELPDEEKNKILDHKKNLDSYYKNKVSFKHSFKTLNGTTKTVLIISPTSRYTKNQYLALCTVDRHDLLTIAENKSSSTLERFGNSSSKSSSSLKRKRRHSIASFNPELLNSETIAEVLKTVEESLNPNSIIPNNSNIEGIANLLNELSPNSLIGQNAFDASTDAHYQHLQIFTDVPTNLIPAFTSPAELKFETKYKDSSQQEQVIQCSRIRPESFPGTIYKISASANDKKTINTLLSIQDRFLAAQTNGSSLNLIGRKTVDGYEYYFVLRKSIIAHPQLQENAIKAGTTRPGWAEMIGIRIGKNEEFFNAIPDEQYHDFLNTFAVEQKECVTFEDIVKTELRDVGSVNYNLLEINLRSLRSDAETSQMYHCIKLSGSKNAESALHLIMNAPQDMQPNIFITASQVDNKHSFESLSADLAEKMLIRKGNDQNYGVIAIDEHVLTVLPEFNLLKNNKKLDQENYKKRIGNEDQSYKSFLINSYKDNPSVFLFLSYLSDNDIEFFKKDPIPLSEINIHQALIRYGSLLLKESSSVSQKQKLIDMKFNRKQRDNILKKEAPNIRTEEYEYGNSHLISSSEPIDIEKIEKQSSISLLLGGNKFNTHPQNLIIERMTEAKMLSKFTSIIIKYFNTQCSNVNLAVDETANLINEMYQPKNSLDIEKKCNKLISVLTEIKSNPQLEIDLPSDFLEKVKERLSRSVAMKMIPIYQEHQESYNLQQFGLESTEIPSQFQYNGLLVPCDFKTYITPDLKTVCCDTVSFEAPVIPTGKKIAIVMNGGQASGVSDVVVGAILIAGPENDISIFTHGNDGLLKGDAVKVTIEDLDMIRSQGGFPGGTTRTPLLTDVDKKKVQENIQKFDGVIFIGGDGSYRSNKDVFLTANVPVYFCIKTIDGDFQVEDTDFTLGYYTAIEGYGEMIENRFIQAKENSEIHFLQVGGRYAGYLAVGTSAILPDAARPNFSIYPEEIIEKKWSFKAVIKMLANITAHRIATSKPYGVFSLAEGTIQELSEVKELINEIKKLKEDHPEIEDDQLKEFLKLNLSRSPSVEGQYSPYETLLAFTDEDVKLLGKPDPIGRVPFAQIDSYAAFGRLLSNRLQRFQTSEINDIEIVNEEIEMDNDILDNSVLKLTKNQLDNFIRTPIPSMKGTKSNYDQRSRPAIKKDRSNGLMQGMAAVSAALFGTKIDGQASAIIATSTNKDNVVAISTKVKPGGELISSSHEYVKLRNKNLKIDMNK